MNMREKYEDGPSNVYHEAVQPFEASVTPGKWPIRKITCGEAKLMFPGGNVDTSGMRASHPNGTPTTITNTKHTRPAEMYPGEAERMIDTWTQNAIAALQRARDATTGPRLVSELEEAQHAIGEALRWGKP